MTEDNRKKEARYISDVSTIEGGGFRLINSLKDKNTGFYSETIGYKNCIGLNILPENYERWAKNKNQELSKEKIKSFLQEDRQKYESIGCGFHNEVYYFGTKLFKEGKSYTAIITSSKEFYVGSEIKDNFCLNYKDDFFDEGVDNVLSKEVIYKWLYENTEDITFKSVYDKLITLFKKYIFFDDERKYSLLACYRIAGFFMPIWRARGRLFIYAEMGSAKSRVTQILHNTGFNSIALGDWTLAYLQRLIESTRGETHIDDFETLEDDKKNATIRLVKTGFMKGFKAGKISDGKTKKPEIYDLFNTTTLNNTEGLDFISTDRCITLRIPKIAKKEFDKEPNFQEQIWKLLRDELYILGLKYSEIVAETYEKINSDKIRGRLFFIIKPEFTIAKIISEELYQDLENFWVEEIGQRQDIDFETDWEFLALKQIYKLLSTLSTNSTLPTKSTLSTTEYFSLLDDVVKPIGLELYGEDEFKQKKRSMGIIIGNCLRRSPIFKKRLVKGKTQFKVDKNEFISLLEAKNFLKYIEVDIVDSVDCVVKKMAIGPNNEIDKTPVKPEELEFLDQEIKESGIDKEVVKKSIQELDVSSKGKLKFKII